MHWVLGTRSALDKAVVESVDLTADRARAVELFLMVYYVLDILAFACTFSGCTTLHVAGVVWAILRIVDIIQASVNVVLFDRIRGRKDNRVASQTRLATLAIMNYLEFIVCFAAIYATGLLGELEGASSPWDALYFSVLTQLTISFGDVLPVAAIRIAAPIQALSGLLFLVIIFARIISALPGIKELIGEENHDV